MGKKRREAETVANSANEYINSQKSGNKNVTKNIVDSVEAVCIISNKVTDNKNGSKDSLTDNETTNAAITTNGICNNNGQTESPLVDDNEQQQENLKTKLQTTQANAETDKQVTTTDTKLEKANNAKSEFKLRVVPLEKLLAKPTEGEQRNAKQGRVHTAQQQQHQQQQQSRKRALRERNNTSIIELSDSTEAEDEEVQYIRQPAKRTKSNIKNITRYEISSDEEQETSQRKSTRTKEKQVKVGNDKIKTRSNRKSSASDFEEPDNRRPLRNNSTATSKRLVRRSSSNDRKEKGREIASVDTGRTKETESCRSTALSVFKVRRFCVRLQRLPLNATEKTQKQEQQVLSVTLEEKPKKMASMEPSSSSSSSNNRKRNARQKSDDEDSDYDAHTVEEAEVNSDASAAQTDDDDDDDAAGGANSSDSEVMPQRKKRGSVKAKKKNGSSDDSDFEPEEKKRRRRIKKNSSDSEDGKRNGGGGDDDDDDEKNKNKRKHIRKIIKTKDLDVTTKEAAKEEEDRRKRIEERQRVYNQIFEKPDNIEINELVLDFDAKSKKTLLEVDKKLLKKLKPHQVAGVKFMWDACFETLKDTEEKVGSGCILAHCMGLGKTLQVVTLSHTLLSNSRRTNIERVLIISPLSTLNNWAREFVHWMGFAQKRDIEVYDISRYKDKPTRIFKLNEWYQEGGVCILGYDMYRILANEKAKGLRKKQREQLQEALVDPGPDLVVCDEGHLLKNEKTSISKAVTKMRTRRRIVLTGTPLQNNLKEYYCMIQFIKPNLLGTYKEYMNRFVNPITNGQYMDSTERDLRLMKHRSHILHKLLEGCIQRRDYCVLAPYLPPKHEYVVYTGLSELQQELYEYYMTTQRDLTSSDMSGKGARLFQDFQDLRRIWTHPMNLRVNSDNVIAKRLLNNDDSDMEGFICDESESEAEASGSSDSDESFKSDASGVVTGGGGGGGAGGTKGKRRQTRNTGFKGDESDSQDGLSAGGSSQKNDPSEWWKRFVEDKELSNINHSPKLLILMGLLQQCEAIGDKLLVFSQSLQSLEVIEHFLGLIDSSTHNYEFEGDVGNFKGVWQQGKDYFRLDGSCSVEQREAMCKKFNDKTNLRARLFLISTRAGGLGINLVAANRVVIFDVSWNPSHDTQSIFRVYRFGQTKPCYIYRLIAMGTMEQKVYERQVAKQATAKRVIDEQQISRHYNQTDLMELYTYELNLSGEREVPILPKDRLFAELLSEHSNLIIKYHEHDSLLEQEENETLSEMERKAAWDEYEAEKTRTVQTSQYISYDRGAFGGMASGQFGNASGSVTSNKIFGFRSDVLLQLLNMKIAKDYPDMSQNQVIQLVPNYLQTLYTQMNNGDPTMYKDLLSLHSTIVHPSGMYMNPLLYANQNPSAAGYFQSGQAAGAAPQPGAAAVPAAPANNASGFKPDEVYEID